MGGEAVGFLLLKFQGHKILYKDFTLITEFLFQNYARNLVRFNI